MDSVAVSEAVDPGSTPGACTTFKTSEQTKAPLVFTSGAFCLKVVEIAGATGATANA